MNIQHIISTNNLYLIHKTLETLQVYLTTPCLDKESSLDIVKDMLLFPISHLNKLDYSIKTLGNQYAIMDTPVDDFHSDVLLKVVLKLNSLNIEYPNTPEISELLEKLSVEYYQHIMKLTNGDYSKFQTNINKKITVFFPETYQYFLEKFSIDKHIIPHPLIDIYRQLLEKTEQLKSQPTNSKIINELALFWKKNDQHFHPEAISSGYFVEEYLHSSDSSLINFWKTVRQTNLSEVNPHIMASHLSELFLTPHHKDSIFYHVHKIQHMRYSISHMLFDHFLHYPEIHQQFPKTIPPYFQFCEWSSSLKFQIHHLEFTQKHINILSQYHTLEGYSTYIERIFHISQAELNQQHNDLNFLTSIIDKKLNWNVLFNNPELPKSLTTELEKYIYNFPVVDYPISGDENSCLLHNHVLQDIIMKWKTDYLEMTLIKRESIAKKIKI